MRKLPGIVLLCLVQPLAARGEPAGVEELIRQMSSRLASLESLRFTAAIAFDDVPAADIKVKYAGSMEVSVQRPDRLRLTYRDELTAREVWIDGVTVTVLSPEEKLFAAAPAASSIDATFDRFAAEYGVSMPLDDFVRGDPYSVLMAGAKASRYVGLSDIQGVPCHHLIVGQEDISWQIWIEASDRMLPRQLVITYRNLPMAPEFVAVMRGWELNPDLRDAVFEAEVPGDATQIDFRSLREDRP